MLDLHTTDEFARWFEALHDSLAEEVTSAVELTAALGPERAPERSSALLLWYQAPEARTGLAPRFEQALDDFPLLSERLRGLLKYFESQAVRRKLVKLPGERAMHAFVALERIAARAHWAQLYSRGGAQVWLDVEALARSICDAIGVELPRPAPCTGLRELQVGTRKPGWRILYGVDVERSRGLLISGESLDRSAYGPSVRRALALWHEFMDGQEQRVVP